MKLKPILKAGVLETKAFVLTTQHPGFLVCKKWGNILEWVRHGWMIEESEDRDSWTRLKLCRLGRWTGA